MSFWNIIQKHKHSEADEIFYELTNSLRNLLEVFTPSGDPKRVEEENEAVYRGRISWRIAINYFNKKNWFEDESEDETEEEDEG